MTNAEVGARIRVLRQERGWTQAELGRRLDPPRTQHAVSQIESGARGLQVDALCVWAGALHTTVATLLGLDGLLRGREGDLSEEV